MIEQMISVFQGFMAGFILSLPLIYLVIPAAIRYVEQARNRNKNMFFSSHFYGSDNF